MKKLFTLRGQLPEKTNTFIGIAGFCIMMLVWYCVTTFTGIPHAILPSPVDVLRAFPIIHFQDFLLRNLAYSLKINYLGYFYAVLFALPVGFAIGLFPLFRALFLKYVDAIRFLPLTACIGLFIAWFGMHDDMKVNFLSFGIFVYLLPVVVERIIKIDEVYEQTAKTMGATKWQIIRTVYFPAVMSQLISDIRVLVAISWTYIIIAEMTNDTGGIGAKIFMASRQSHPEKVWAYLIIIIMFGIIQDFGFKLLDKLLFRHKYYPAERM